MLNTQSDRLDYREMLSPPMGYKVSFAFGTTYSLDLETLTAMCAIIGLNVEADTELSESPLHMLEAIRRASKKLLVFCQGAQIKVPDKPNKLLPLLESCVCEVNLKNKKSFHPKTWFIHYTSKGMPDRYRLVVLSRNFTFDRSWDVAVRLDSASQGDSALRQEPSTGKAIGGFIRWLIDNTSAYNPDLRKKHKTIEKLIDGFAASSWKPIGREIESIDFIPYGIGQYFNSNLFDDFNKLFVISPFLSKGIMEQFAQRRRPNADCTLITRNSELPKLNGNLLTIFETYVVKDIVVDGEDQVIESGDTQQQDIHAKVYLRTKGEDSELYIGSANASYSAFQGGNVECLFVLRGKQKNLSVEKLKMDLFGTDEKKNPFERVNLSAIPKPDDETETMRMETAIREFCATRKQAVVSDGEPYSVTVKIRPPQTDVRLTLSPLMKPNAQQVSEVMVFPKLGLCDLSEWYEVTAKLRGQEPLRRVIKIPTEGIPTADRDKALYSDVISDRNAFLAYIAFLLSDDYLSAFIESMKKAKGEYRFLNMNYDSPILYERMLKAAANSPDSLRDIREIISMLNAHVVPQDFLRLYEQFEKAVKL